MRPTRLLYLGMSFACGVGLLAFSSAHARDPQVHLSIERSANPKIHVALPPITLETASGPRQSPLEAIVIEDLRLSGALSPVSGTPAIRQADADDEVAGRIFYANWSHLGADIVLKIEDASTKTHCVLRVSAFDVQKGRRILSKRYQGLLQNIRRVVHTMTAELMRTLTGAEGISLSRIAFVSDVTGDKELYLMDYDGARVRRLSTDRSIFLYPRWAPGGKRLAALSYLKGRPHVYEIDVAQGSRKQVAHFPGLNAGASYSPDGKSLGLTLSKDGNPELYKLNLLNGKTQRLTEDRALDSSASWSPDGKSIAFVSDRSGSPQVYAMDANGNNQRRLTHEGSYNSSPAWSPTGEWIAYCSLVGKAFQIRVLDMRSKKSYAITADGRDNEDPSWAPDGRHLVYSSTKNHHSDLFLIDIYDRDPIQLTHRLGNCVTPSWSENIER